MALPWLESMSAFAATSSSPFPKRFAVLFMGNGVNENHWGATGSGDDMKLSLSLSPLEPIKKKEELGSSPSRRAVRGGGG